MAIQNAINFTPLQSFINYGMFASAGQYQIVNSTQQITTDGSGNYDLYTVPAGYKAVMNGINFTNVSGGTFSINVALKQGGVYYILQSATVSIANNATNAIIPYYIFNPGDVISVNCTVAAALVNISMQLVLYKQNYLGTTYNVTSFGGTGVYNTLYTLPASTQAIFAASSTVSTTGGGIQLPPGIFIWNHLGSAQTYNTYFVAPAGSPTANNQITKAINVNNNVLGLQPIPGSPLTTAGTTIQIETVTASTNSLNQWMWLTVYEFPQ